MDKKPFAMLRFVTFRIVVDAMRGFYRKPGGSFLELARQPKDR